MYKLFEKCALCPRKCNINRNNNELGFCKASNKLKIARYSLHFWEEPSISGEKGSGTIFFSHCNLKCIYCQNYEIITCNYGTEISVKRFAEICLDLEKQGALNINLVTPTHFIPLIKDGIILAKKDGLNIPIVYNTSSYDSIEALKELEGLIDIYLPDFKYYNDFYATKYSNCHNYVLNAKKCINEMYRQVGPIKLENGILKKGIIVRHLVLPGMEEDAKNIINYLYNTFKNNIYISIMNQYTPIKKLPEEILNTTISNKKYDEIINYACDLGVTNAYIQEGKTQKKSFIPDFKNQDI